MSNAELVARLRAVLADLSAVVDDLETEPEPTPEPEPERRTVDVVAVPGDGSVQVSWTVNDGADVTSFVVGRDGKDASGSGPWSTTEPPDVRGRLFTKLLAGVPYEFTVVARYADGEIVTASAAASPTGVTPVPEPGPQPNPQPQPTENRSGLPWVSGVFVHDHEAETAEAFGRDRGAPVDIVVAFPELKTWKTMLDPWWQRAIPAGAEACIKVPLWPKAGGVADGVDDKWATLARQVADVSSTAWVTPGWEMNIGQHWRITPENRRQWVAAWRRAVEAMLGVCSTLRIGWNPNAGRDQTGVDTVQVFGELADLVHGVGPDSYDAWPACVDPDAWRIHRGYLDRWRTVAEHHGKKLIVPEWGGASGSQWDGHQGGDNPYYVRQYLGYFREHASILAFEAYFDEPAGYVASSLGQLPRLRDAYRAVIADARA